MTDSKIKDLDELSVILAERREKENLKVVHCHGIFDLVHIGHIRHFKEARGFGDILVVTITPDHLVNKGPGRPVFTESLRLEFLAGLDAVDYVALNRWPTAVKTIACLKPDFYVKGVEYRDVENDVTGKITDEQQAVEDGGGKLVFTDDVVYSSSALINRHLSALPEPVVHFLQSFRERHDFREIQETIERCAALKVLVIGETIIDEYQYCQTMGKSGKEPILAAQYLATERNIGGVLAATNHIAAITPNVTVVSQLGEIDSNEAFVRESLSSSVHPEFLTVKNSPTIVKRRYVEKYPFQKLFEIYVINEHPPLQAQHDLRERLATLLPDFDLVVVTDYGHGMLEDDVVDLLCDKAPYLAVNTQKNAGNHGFNTVSKYRRADFVCISEQELRLDARKRTGNAEELTRFIADQLSCRGMLVTQGRDGCLCYKHDSGFSRAPALTTNIRDRVGAGDAVFAVASMCSYLGAPNDIVGIIANGVGAQAVETVCNRDAIDKIRLLKYLQHLLK